MYKIINKIAFVITDFTTYNHLKEIINVLPEGSYDIVTFFGGECANSLYLKVRKCIKKLFLLSNSLSEKYIDNPYLRFKEISSNWITYDLNELIEKKIKYKVSVCVFPNTITTDTNNRSLLNLLSETCVRAAFISGAFKYMLNKEQNMIFDYILCSGEEQKQLFDNLGLNTKVYACGTPRLLPIVSNLNDPLFRKLDKNKKTILWIPTHGRKTCSILPFLNTITVLQKKYNVILSFPAGLYGDYFCLRRKLTKNISLIVNDRDSSSILHLADYVFCDYGGSVFSAIYYDKNVLFLNSKNREAVEKNFGVDSPEVKLREEIINFDEDEGDRIVEALSDDKIWEEQKQIRADIKKRFFTIGDEPASQRVANILLDILSKKKVS